MYILVECMSKLKTIFILLNIMQLTYLLTIEKKSFSYINETNFNQKNYSLNKENSQVFSLFGKGTLFQNNINHLISNSPYSFIWDNGIFKTENFDSLKIIDSNNNLIFILPSSKLLILKSQENNFSKFGTLESGYLRIKTSNSKSTKFIKITTPELQLNINNNTDLAIIRGNEMNRFYTRIIVFSGESKINFNNNLVTKYIKLMSYSDFKIYEDRSYEIVNDIESSLIENYVAWTITPIKLKNNYTIKNKNINLNNEKLCVNKIFIFKEEKNQKEQEYKCSEQNEVSVFDKNNKKNKYVLKKQKEKEEANTFELNKNASLYLIANTGYSMYYIFNKGFVGYNLGLKVLFADQNTNTPINLVYGFGMHYEYVKNSTSGDNSYGIYSSSSTFTSFSLGGDLGIKYATSKKFMNFLLASVYISPYSKYDNNISFSSTSSNLSPTINSNWNMGLSYHGVYNINDKMSLGAEIFAAQGLIDYSSVQSNGYIFSGNYGTYYFLNFDVSFIYYLPIN